MILADENIDSHLVAMLRSNGIEVSFIRENHQGVSDEEVISISKNPPRIILTEDKDFGEWVYAHKERDISVILLAMMLVKKMLCSYITGFDYVKGGRFIWKVYYYYHTKD